MPSIEFSVWRFAIKGKDGVNVGQAVRTEKTGKEAWRRACLDVSSIIAGDCRRRGNPHSYGIAMSFTVNELTIQEAAVLQPPNDEQLEILPESEPLATPAHENGRRKRSRNK